MYCVKLSDSILFPERTTTIDDISYIMWPLVGVIVVVLLMVVGLAVLLINDDDE